MTEEVLGVNMIGEVGLGKLEYGRCKALVPFQKERKGRI